MNNIIEIKDYMLNLEGVNKEVFEQSFDKHFASISDIKTVDELKELIAIYEENGENIVNQELGGIIEFTKLARNPQEIIAYCDANSYGRRSA